MLPSYVLLLPILFGLTECSNILIVSTVSSHSHSLWCNKLAEELVLKGHKVTLLDTDPPRKNLTNLTTYTLETAYNFEPFDLDDLSVQNSPEFSIDIINKFSTFLCKNMMKSKTFKHFFDTNSIKNKPFDLIIHDMCNCENFLGLVHAFGNPKLIGLTAYGEPASLLYLSKNHQNMIHDPLHNTPHVHPMTFYEKIKNLYYNLYFYYKFYYYLEEINSFSQSFFGNSTPHVQDIAEKMSMVFVNSHPILDGAKYYSPAIIQISGFHIDKPKPLNDDLKSFLDGSGEHGAIYFSFGSNFLSANMSKEKKQMFINVFKKLPQRILWKYEDEDIEDLPKNVKMSKWFRQSDVLAHPKIRIFISHTGLLGTQEAIHNGVPVIGIPFMIDQHFLITKLAKKGVAIHLSYSDLTEDKLFSAIQTMIEDNSYYSKMKTWSKIFKDRPIQPKDSLLYWIEFVLRHDDLSFLQPPLAQLSPYESFIWDVRTLFFIFIGILVYYFPNFFCRANSRWKKNKRESNQRQKKYKNN